MKYKQFACIFGFESKLSTFPQKEKNERAKTRIGTPRYVSPEVLQGKEYLFSTDIWSLGNFYPDSQTEFYP